MDNDGGFNLPDRRNDPAFLGNHRGIYWENLSGKQRKTSIYCGRNDFEGRG